MVTVTEQPPSRRPLLFAATLAVVAGTLAAVLVLTAPTERDPDPVPGATAASPDPATTATPAAAAPALTSLAPADPLAAAVLVTDDGVGYGRRDLGAPTLDAQGIACTPDPLPTQTLTERAPDPSGMDRDFGPAEALVGIDREVFNCLAQCLPTDPERWHGVDLAAARPCFDDTTVAVVRAVGLTDAWSVVRAMLAGWPQLSFFCHLSGHKAGKVAFQELGVDLESSMLEVEGDCIAGALHGLLDAYGESVPPVEDFAVPVRACLALDSGECADGVGHAAWTAYRDYGEASEICGLFAEQSFRFICDGGVFMRQLEENAVGMTMPDAEDRTLHQAWLETVVDVCERFRDANRRELAEDPGLGCWTTIPYLLWMPLSVTARELGGDLSQLDMVTILADIATACDAMGPVGAPACRKANGENVAPIAGYDPDLSMELCALVSSSSTDLEACRKSAGDLIEFSESAR